MKIRNGEEIVQIWVTRDTQSLLRGMKATSRRGMISLLREIVLDAYMSDHSISVLDKDDPKLQSFVIAKAKELCTEYKVSNITLSKSNLEGFVATMLLRFKDSFIDHVKGLINKKG